MKKIFECKVARENESHLFTENGNEMFLFDTELEVGKVYIVDIKEMEDEK